MVLVGDSLGMVMCGQDTTVGVTLREVECVVQIHNPVERSDMLQ